MFHFLLGILDKLADNLPPALCCGGFFIADVYKYTEKFERE
ncbi:hypothetical protein FEDK69T_30900 [Flavobacterium enshiense DK69]|nr:hypothetical protein FEDK69T_30900 [Flavobacterium enshiense DK69]